MQQIVAEQLGGHHDLVCDNARTKMEGWLGDRNNVQLYGATGDKPPLSLMKGSQAASAT